MMCLEKHPVLLDSFYSTVIAVIVTIIVPSEGKRTALNKFIPTAKIIFDKFLHFRCIIAAFLFL